MAPRLARFTILPNFLFRISFAASRHSRKVPIKFVSKMLLAVSTGVNKM
jgi:hypothetical protein